MTITIEQTEAINAVRNAYHTNIAKLERALSSGVTGYVHVWPRYWIGIKVNADVCHGVAVDCATVTHRSDKRTFTNGYGQRSVLMNRHEALAGALRSARENLAAFEQALAEQVKAA